jgi:predicted Zn-dependent protease
MCCGWAPLRGWRDGSLMLIDAPRPELYDTGADAAQTRNVAADRPAEFARLKGALTEAMRHQSASARADTSPSTTAQLASLGYVAPGSVAKPSLRDPKDMAAISARIGRAIDIEDSNPAAAARELAAAVQQDPQNPLARRHLGASLLRAGRLQEASAVLHALASDGADSTDTLTQLADLAFEQRDFRQARARLETIYGRDPQDATALKLGIACAKSGDIDRAIALFEIVVSRDPANVDARVDLAGALLQRGRAAEAARQFQGAIDAGAAAPLVWNGLASAKMQSGDRRGAADALRESLRLEPNQADIARTLAGLDR